MKKNFSALRVALCLLAICCLLPCFAACSNYRNDMTATEVMDKITTAVPSEDGYEAASGSYINESAWGSDYQTLLDATDNYQILRSQKSDMNIDEIGVFHIKDGENMDKLEDIVENYLDMAEDRNEPLLQSYNPAEIPKLDNAEVEVCGQYILYTILSDSNTTAAHKAFKDALKK